MRTIKLTQEQRDKVLAELNDVQGEFNLQIEVADDITIEAQGYVYVDGYRESDTNAYIETSRTADVILTAFVGEDSEVCDLPSDFETEVYNYLNAA